MIIIKVVGLLLVFWGTIALVGAGVWYSYDLIDKIVAYFKKRKDHE